MLEGELHVVARAWDLQKQAGITDIPVPLEKYFAVANAKLHVRFDLKPHEAGQTCPIGDSHVIIVNGNHNAERQRFTALHELGHIWLGLPSKHGDSISADDLLRYRRRPREEMLCDIFASECLLPRQFFAADVRKRPCTFRSVQELAELYEASLPATGSRFAAYSEFACAWVLADERHVRYVSYSPAMRDTGFWVKPGTEVPRASVLGRLSDADPAVTPGVADVVPAHVWVNNDCRAIEEFSEAAIAAPSLSQGYALLCADDLKAHVRELGKESDEDNERLAELDGVLRFHKRHRKR